MPPTVTTSPSRRRSSSASRQSVLRSQLPRAPLSSGCSETYSAEALLLEPQQILLAVLARTASVGWCRSGTPVSAPPPRSKIEPWPESRSAWWRDPQPEISSSMLEDPAPRRPGRAERAALRERLERPLVHELRIDALGEVPDGRERPALAARGDDRARGRLADVLHRVQAEPDLPLDHREVRRRLVHVGRQHVDPHLLARGHVERARGPSCS